MDSTRGYLKRIEIIADFDIFHSVISEMKEYAEARRRNECVSRVLVSE